MKLKRSAAVAAAVLGLAGVAAAGEGNGLPSGPHYNLQIIAHNKCPGTTAVDSNRHTIFLLANYTDSAVEGQTRLTLDPTNKIKLVQGEFQVLDGNACDGNSALFQLPANPYTCPDGGTSCEDPTFQKYRVYVRPRGKPGTGIKMTSCGFLAGEDGVLGTADDVSGCSTENLVQLRTKGGAKFIDATKVLTTLNIDVTGDGVPESIGLFDPRMVDYFWSADTTGKAHLQVVFVPVGA